MLVRELDDPFAEIGFDDFDAPLLEIRAEIDLLGDHRLTFDHQLDAALHRETSDDFLRLLGVPGSVDDAPDFRRLGLELLDQLWQSIDAIALDRRQTLLPIRKGAVTERRV